MSEAALSSYEIQEAGTMRELIEELKRREKGQTASDAAAH
jgi:hypothetical protein